MKPPTSCYVLHCRGPVEGQMFCCAAHFGLLSEGLRLALVAAYDALRAEDRRGNVRRATREEWWRLRWQASDEWRAIRERLQAALNDGVIPVQPGHLHGGALVPDGRTWARMLAVLDAPPEEQRPAGGPLLPGAEYWVGERGPEDFLPVPRATGRKEPPRG